MKPSSPDQHLHRRIRSAQHSTLAGALLMLALLGGLAAWTAAAEYRKAAQDILVEIERSAQKLAWRTTEVFERIDQTMLLIRYVNESGARPSLPSLQALQHAGLFADSVLSVSITDAAGAVVDSSSSQAGVADLSASPGFQRLKQRDDVSIDIGPTGDNPLTGRPEIPVMRRLNRAGGSFAGVVVAMIDPAALTRQNERTEAPGTLTGVVGLDGVMRVRMEDGQLSYGLRLDLSAVEVRTRQMRQTLLPLPSGRSDRLRFVTNVRVPRYPLLAVVTVDADGALASYRSTRGQIMDWAALACTLVAAGALMLWLQLRRIESGRSRIQRTEAALRATLEGSKDAISILQARRDSHGTLVDMVVLDTNERAAALLGGSRGQVLGRGVCELRPAIRTTGQLERFEQVMNSRRTLEVELQAVAPDLNGRWLHHQMVPLDDGLALITRDVTERKATERALASLARSDPLTQVGNRRDFEQRLSEAHARSLRSHQTLAVLYVDLDGFKGVNDTFGHAVGDEVLVAVAARLKDCVRATDRVCRLGGDEFAVVLENAGSPDDVAGLCLRIVRVLEQPHWLAAGAVVCTPSVGAALLGAGEPLEDLLSRADQAMYAVKQAGRCGYRVDAGGGEVMQASLGSSPAPRYDAGCLSRSEVKLSA